MNLNQEVRVYTCTLCNHQYSYLILEYDIVVCEQCSLIKNFSAKDLEEFHRMSGGKLEEESSLEEEESAQENIPEKDVVQLMEVIKKIENPRLREDFLSLAEEYLSEG